MTNKELLLKASSAIKDQAQKIDESMEKIASFEKKAEAEEIAKKMVDQGYLTTVDQYLNKVAELEAEEDLGVVREALKHGILQKEASDGFGNLQSYDSDGSSEHGEVTDFLLSEL